MSDYGIVVYREEQLADRDGVFRSNGNNDMYLLKHRYAVMKEEKWPDGSPVWHCKHCKYCIRFVRVINKKMYHLGYWCSFLRSRVDGDGNCTAASERTRTVTIVIGNEINKMFDGEKYLADKVCDGVAGAELSTGADKSVDKDVNRLSTGSCEQAQDVGKDGVSESQQSVESEK